MYQRKKIQLNSIEARYIKFQVDSFYGKGGGLQSMIFKLAADAEDEPEDAGKSENGAAPSYEDADADDDDDYDDAEDADDDDDDDEVDDEDADNDDDDDDDADDDDDKEEEEEEEEEKEEEEE